MVNPITATLAYLGGRSTEEIAAAPESKDLDSSTLIGLAAVVSIAVMFLGQRLFWQSIPATAQAATLLAVTLATVYMLFYRVLIRASEVMGWLGKGILWTCGIVLAAVNALLAGHELVLLPFGPQVQATAMQEASDGVKNLRESQANARGLPQLAKAQQEAVEQETAARQHLNATPEAVLTLQKQASACDAAANRLAQTMPAVADPLHDSVAEQLASTRQRCRYQHGQANRALAAHNQNATALLAGAKSARQAAQSRYGDAAGEVNQAMALATPVVEQAATTGFARHAALWRAVETGRIPAWAALGLMAVALLLEALPLLLKMLLPTDAAGWVRINAALCSATMAKTERAFTREFQRQLGPAVKQMGEKLRTDAENLVSQSVAPSIQTRMAAAQWNQAFQATHKAQKSTHSAATPVVAQLAKVTAPGVA